MGLSKQEALILELLGFSACYGLELVHNSSGRLHSGTVYVALSRMEDAGLVESHEEGPAVPGGINRRQYRATRGGMQALSDYQLAAAAAAGAAAETES